MSATVLSFPGGDVLAAQPPPDRMIESARDWMRDALQHQLNGSDAINRGEVGAAITELLYARTKFDRCLTIMLEARGNAGDSKKAQLEAVALTLSAVAGEFALLPTGIPALTAHRLDVQADRIDNALARTLALAAEYRASASAALEEP
jgi:hypothetical protein